MKDKNFFNQFSFKTDSYELSNKINAILLFILFCLIFIFTCFLIYVFFHPYSEDYAGPFFIIISMFGILSIAFFFIFVLELQESNHSHALVEPLKFLNAFTTSTRYKKAKFILKNGKMFLISQKSFIFTTVEYNKRKQNIILSSSFSMMGLLMLPITIYTKSPFPVFMIFPYYAIVAFLEYYFKESYNSWKFQRNPDKTISTKFQDSNNAIFTGNFVSKDLMNTEISISTYKECFPKTNIKNEEQLLKKLYKLNIKFSNLEIKGDFDFYNSSFYLFSTSDYEQIEVIQSIFIKWLTWF